MEKLLDDLEIIDPLTRKLALFIHEVRQDSHDAYLELMSGMGTLVREPDSLDTIQTELKHLGASHFCSCAEADLDNFKSTWRYASQFVLIQWGGI